MSAPSVAEATELTKIALAPVVPVDEFAGTDLNPGYYSPVDRSFVTVIAEILAYENPVILVKSGYNPNILKAFIAWLREDGAYREVHTRLPPASFMQSEIRYDPVKCRQKWSSKIADIFENWYRNLPARQKSSKEFAAPWTGVLEPAWAGVLFNEVLRQTGAKRVVAWAMPEADQPSWQEVSRALASIAAKTAVAGEPNRLLRRRILRFVNFINLTNAERRFYRFYINYDEIRAIVLHWYWLQNPQPGVVLPEAPNLTVRPESRVGGWFWKFFGRPQYPVLPVASEVARPAELRIEDVYLDRQRLDTLARISASSSEEIVALVRSAQRIAVPGIRRRIDIILAALIGTEIDIVAFQNAIADLKRTVALKGAGDVKVPGPFGIKDIFPILSREGAMLEIASLEPVVGGYHPAFPPESADRPWVNGLDDYWAEHIFNCFLQNVVPGYYLEFSGAMYPMPTLGNVVDALRRMVAGRTNPRSPEEKRFVDTVNGTIERISISGLSTPVLDGRGSVNVVGFSLYGTIRDIVRQWYWLNMRGYGDGNFGEPDTPATTMDSNAE